MLGFFQKMRGLSTLEADLVTLSSQGQALLDTLDSVFATPEDALVENEPHDALKKEGQETNPRFQHLHELHKIVTKLCMNYCYRHGTASHGTASIEELWYSVLNILKPLESRVKSYPYLVNAEELARFKEAMTFYLNFCLSAPKPEFNKAVIYGKIMKQELKNLEGYCEKLKDSVLGPTTRALHEAASDLYLQADDLEEKKEILLSLITTNKLLFEYSEGMEIDPKLLAEHNSLGMPKWVSSYSPEWQAFGRCMLGLGFTIAVMIGVSLGLAVVGIPVVVGMPTTALVALYMTGFLVALASATIGLDAVTAKKFHTPSLSGVMMAFALELVKEFDKQLAPKGELGDGINNNVAFAEGEKLFSSMTM